MTNKTIRSISLILQQIVDADMNPGESRITETADGIYRFVTRCFSQTVIIINVRKNGRAVTELLVDKENRRFIQKAEKKKCEAENNAIFCCLSRDMNSGKFQEVEFEELEGFEPEAESEYEGGELPQDVGTLLKNGIGSLFGSRK